MGNQRHALGTGVSSHFLHVVIRRRTGKIEIGKRIGAPPGVVPTLEQDTLDVVGGGKVDIPHRILRRRTVAFPAPGFHAQVQAPPNADIFHGLDPGDIVDRAGLVQVQDQRRVHQAHGTAGDLDGSPGGLEGAGDQGDEIPGRSRG